MTCRLRACARHLRGTALEPELCGKGATVRIAVIRSGKARGEHSRLPSERFSRNKNKSLMPDRLLRGPVRRLGRKRQCQSTVLAHENDTGPDVANHGEHRIFIHSGHQRLAKPVHSSRSTT